MTSHDVMGETSHCMLSEESEADVEGSFVFRTFDEDEYESPAESGDDEY